MGEEVPQQPRKKKLVLLGMLLTFLIVGLIVFCYWLVILRFESSTDDAYVHGNQILVTSQISGFIQTIHVEETEVVEEGTVLVTLDLTDSFIALEEAKHALANTVRRVVTLFERVAELREELKIREAELIKLTQDFAHRKELLEGGAVSTEQFEHAEANYLAGLYAVEMTAHQLKGARAEVENTTLITHPLVEEGKDRLRRAYVDFRRCQVVAPSRGMIAQRRAQVGQAVAPGEALMFLVPLEQIWVNANFKETELVNVRIGQPVTMISDLYGDDVPFHGHVMGLWPGTGSVFAVLPPQNATGNWIKIVQRLPVRITLDPKEIQENPLRLGLTLSATIDTHDREGKRLPLPTEAPPLFKTNIYPIEMEGVEEMIEEIIEENIPSFAIERMSPTDEF